MQLNTGVFRVVSLSDLPLLVWTDFGFSSFGRGFNLVSDKDRELGEAQAEIKALRLSERLREKAVEEVMLIPHPSMSFVSPGSRFLEIFEIFLIHRKITVLVNNHLSFV